MGIFSGRYEPEQVQRQNGSVLRCEICKNTTFYRREGKIQTTAMTLFDLDWLNASAECMVCSQCGYVHWFLPV